MASAKRLAVTNVPFRIRRIVLVIANSNPK
jgi:hypothetical protein